MPAGTTEVWRIANLTGDTHPMHIHLVNWQIISRQPFDPAAYPDPQLPRTGPGTRSQRAGLERDGADEPRRGDHGDRQVRSARTLPFTVPVSPRTGGNEYVWHCHILEHEEHDMMHALVVT